MTKLAANEVLSWAGQWACESGETESGGSGGQRKAEQDWSHWGPAEGGHQDQSIPKCSGERHQCPCGLKKRSHTISGFQAHTTVAGKSLVTAQAACFAWSQAFVRLCISSLHICMGCYDSWTRSISCSTEAASWCCQRCYTAFSMLLKSWPGHSMKLLTSIQQSLWCLVCSVRHLLTD